MKIAYFLGIFFPHPGGVQIQTHNIANTIIKMGHKIDFFLLNKTNVKNNLYKTIIINKLIISFFFYLDFFFKLNLSILFRLYLKYFLKIEQYDVFHFHFLNHKMLFILKNLKYFNKKIIVTFHGADIQINRKINYGFRIDKSYDISLKKIINKVDYFLSISKNIKKDILALGVNKNKIFICPNSVSLEKLNKFKSYPKNIKLKICLLTVARFAENKKGLDLIPKIAKILTTNNINYQWSLVGKNISKIKNYNNMDKYKKYFNFFDNIQNFNEHIFPNNKLIKIYKQNHIYINLARIESFGLTILEALACELPVISFNTKGGNELVINNFNGKLINKYSAIEMAKNIISYQKGNQYEKHKKNTITSIKNFDLKNVSVLVVNYYKNLK